MQYEISERTKRLGRKFREATERDWRSPESLEAYFDFSFSMLKDEIRDMTREAMREVDRILGIQEAF